MLTLVWLLPPGSLKRLLLRLLGNQVASTARVGICLVKGRPRLSIGECSTIASGSVFKGLESIRIGENSTIGSFNLFSAHPEHAAFTTSSGRLDVGDSAFITSRHDIDCTGGVFVGDHAAIAGHGTQILTHSIDFKENLQTGAPVVIGARSFVSSRCTLLPGTEIPPRSLVAAGAVVTNRLRESCRSLIAGHPASRVGEIEGEWFARSEGATRSVKNRDTHTIHSNIL